MSPPTHPPNSRPLPIPSDLCLALAGRRLPVIATAAGSRMEASPGPDLLPPELPYPPGQTGHLGRVTLERFSDSQAYTGLETFNPHRGGREAQAAPCGLPPVSSLICPSPSQWSPRESCRVSLPRAGGPGHRSPDTWLVGTREGLGARGPSREVSPREATLGLKEDICGLQEKGG